MSIQITMSLSPKNEKKLNTVRSIFSINTLIGIGMVTQDTAIERNKMLYDVYYLFFVEQHLFTPGSIYNLSRPFSLSRAMQRSIVVYVY